jgi:hypothetical protein
MRLSESKCLLAIMGEVPHVTYSQWLLGVFQLLGELA